ncbi:MAG: plasmid stabilization system protein ParE [Verrucomicrobiales bacterium]|jgi:plasmid stabilization system protein ParE
MQVKTTSKFEQQLVEILNYYTEIDPKLAADLLDRIDYAARHLLQFPSVYARTTEPGIRKIALRRFPYRIRYRVMEEDIHFLTIRHMARME